MHNINEMASNLLALLGKEHLWPNDLSQVVLAWLKQDEVQSLLQAAWSPDLRITREVQPYESVYEEPETGAIDQVRANILIVTTTVNGTEYMKAITFAPDREPLDSEILLAEVALRELLIETALQGPKNSS